MLINRRTFVIKRGQFDAALALMREAVQQGGARGRILIPEVAPFDLLVVEGEFESLAAYEQYWNDWFGQPTNTAFLQRWQSVTETGGTNEIWRVAE